MSEWLERMYSEHPEEFDKLVEETRKVSFKDLIEKVKIGGIKNGKFEEKS